MLRSRFLAAVGFALVVGTLIAAPVSASTVIGPTCSGTCGTYSTFDSNGGPFGAICKYETGSYDLDWIKVSPPRIYGHYSTKTKVRWKFNILRSTNSGSTYTPVYNAAWQDGMASKTAPADSSHGFTSRTWTAPESPTGFFKVRILLRWMDMSGHSEGNAKVEYDWYQSKWNGNSVQSDDHCLQDY